MKNPGTFFGLSEWYQAVPIPTVHCSDGCSIEEPETVTITGGRRVTRYHDDGASKSLPNLNHRRNNHACGVFTRTGGSTVCY